MNLYVSLKSVEICIMLTLFYFILYQPIEIPFILLINENENEFRHITHKTKCI